MVDGNARARLETEPVSVAVHVRQVPDRTAAVALLDRGPAPGRFVTDAEAGQGDAGDRGHRCGQRPASADHGARGADALCLGDDVTGEGGFRALRPEDVPVKVGEGTTAARYRVADPAGALAVLTRLAEPLP
jgi:trehalose 6-phosphate phosphatase